ncbi:MAG: HAD-IIA family hydrolase [gamma proteobacterium symbiont of Lucinoma myriamae]|nr:HAD-IIA family hydrolase [gamma proteobacterium symbiont of Lucinoma myriamae]MCU7818054.1 HAD-IIA family hydrolase [gamma proteobacterium symbiont of Lucinoma myriamae]MCU7832483.1 HAD-IIA family hydrolase [gamma proteobacterium symbiont of Lucinoma myriamae]
MIKNNNLLPFTAILLDMDGVLFHGMNPIDGAMDFMRSIEHIPHVFITNNPIRLPESMADKMAEIGFKRPDEKHIITAGEATATWLSQQKPEFRFFAIGADGLHKSLRKYGYEDKDKADYVVVGEGEGIDYASITTGINLILKQGAQLISTNPDTSVDAFYRGKRAIMPGGGALVAPFIVATGKQPVTIGKPEPLLYEIALQELNVQANDCLMIGDRPDTDILGAQQLGIQTALVRTGRFAPGEKLPDNMLTPDWDVENLMQLKNLLHL